MENNYLRTTQTDFCCKVCNKKMVYVQLIDNTMSMHIDYFQCENCGNRIETLEFSEDEIPAFYD